MTSAGIRFCRSLAATSRVWSSEKYVMRLIHRPKLHSGGMDGLPVSVVYSLRMSLGSPRNTNRSSASSPNSRAVVLPAEAPKSNVAGADVWTNMPYPRLLMKNGIGCLTRQRLHPCGCVGHHNH